jgi:hypothetical protein
MGMEMLTSSTLSDTVLKVVGLRFWKFRVNYGVTYAGWLKNLAGLKDWTKEIAHWTIWTFI